MAGKTGQSETTPSGGGGSGQMYVATRVITGNPWRIDHYEAIPGGDTFIVFENGERVKPSVYRAIVQKATS
jgi:hypothetical protein